MNSTPVNRRTQHARIASLACFAALAAGLSLPGAEQSIFAAYCSQGILKKPQVTVALRETRKVRVYVLGAVNKPGQIKIWDVRTGQLLHTIAAHANAITDTHHRRGEVIPISDRDRDTPCAAPW